ncbi:MAG: hypothetical protein R3D99_00885 [Altererythrobacter sp.]
MTMKKAWIGAAIATAIAIGVPVIAQPTMEQVAKNDQYTYFIHADTIRDGREFGVSVRSAWFEYAHGYMDDIPPGRTMTFEIFDCAAQRTSIQEIVDYKTDGTVHDSNKYDTVSWQRAAPGTIRHAKMTRACRGK